MLEAQLELIESCFDKIEVSNLKVSKASVGWHIDHTVKVMNKVCDTLIFSNPKDYEAKFNIRRNLVFALGFFPRGKAKSPKRVLPPEIILLEDIQTQFTKAKLNLKEIQNLDKNSNFEHPIFKQLNKKQTLRFLKLHTEHHLKIVKDILK
jgi:hypothetical protein